MPHIIINGWEFFICCTLVPKSGRWGEGCLSARYGDCPPDRDRSQRKGEDGEASRSCCGDEDDWRSSCRPGEEDLSTEPSVSVEPGWQRSGEVDWWKGELGWFRCWLERDPIQSWIKRTNDWEDNLNPHYEIVFYLVKFDCFVFLSRMFFSNFSFNKKTKNSLQDVFSNFFIQ